MSGPTSRIKNAYDEWSEIYDTNENKTRDMNYHCIRQQQLDLRNKKVSEYINEELKAGFTLCEIEEEKIPRLLRLLFKKEV